MHAVYANQLNVVLMMAYIFKLYFLSDILKFNGLSSKKNIKIVALHIVFTLFEAILYFPNLEP